MTGGNLDAVTLAQAEESLRQQREIFDRRMEQDRKTFVLRLVTGWAIVVVFVGICAFCGYVIINNEDFTSFVVAGATSALFVEALGLVVAILRGWTGVAPKELEPTTPQPLPAPGQN